MYRAVIILGILLIVQTTSCGRNEKGQGDSTILTEEPKQTEAPVVDELSENAFGNDVNYFIYGGIYPEVSRRLLAPTLRESEMFDSIMNSEKIFLDSLLSNKKILDIQFTPNGTFNKKINGKMYYLSNHTQYEIRNFEGFETDYYFYPIQPFVKAIYEVYDKEMALIVLKNLIHRYYGMYVVINSYGREIYLGGEYQHSKYGNYFVLPKIFNRMLEIFQESGIDVISEGWTSIYLDIKQLSMLLVSRGETSETLTDEKLRSWVEEPLHEAFQFDKEKLNLVRDSVNGKVSKHIPFK